MSLQAYEAYLKANGNTRRERLINSAKRIERKKAQHNPSYKEVLIDGEPRNVTIVYSTEMNHKKITAMPDEELYAGSLVEWNDKIFLITIVDAEDEVHKRGEMYETNTYLKWQDETGAIKETFAYAENISQFKSGIDVNKIITTGEQILTLRVPCNEDTVKLRRGKRFLIDVDTSNPEAFILTGRNTTTGNTAPKYDKDEEVNYKNKILYLTLSYSERSDRDNIDLMIADYIEPNPSPTGYHIHYEDEPVIRVGGWDTVFSLRDSDDNVIDDTIWTVTTLPENEKYIEYSIDNGELRIKALENRKIIGTQIKIEASCKDANESIYVRLVNLLG